MKWLNRSGLILAGAWCLGSGDAAAQVIHGQIDVIQHNGSNAASGVTLSTPVASPGFALNGGNRGDYNLSLNMSFSGGIVMTAPRENGRDNDAVGGGLGGADGTPYGGIRFATTAIDRTGEGWFIPVFTSAMTGEPGGDEFNTNVAAAYFPYSQYLGGRFRNAAGTNGGANDQIDSGHASLLVGTHVVDLSTDPVTPAPGQTLIDFRTLNANTRTGSVLASSATGILLATGGKNEDNYAMSRANADGTFTVFSHDNGANGASFEQDYVGFVYIAANDPSTVAMGRIINEGTAVEGTSSGNYSITKGTAGIWYLSIPGHSESTGTLMISPSGDVAGNTIDNTLTYQWDPANSRWEIQTRDLPGQGLQNAGTGVETFSFAFFAVPEPAFAGLLMPAMLLLARRRTKAG